MHRRAPVAVSIFRRGGWRGSFFKSREFLSRRDASGRTPYFPGHPIDSKPMRRNIVVKKRRNKIKARHATPVRPVSDRCDRRKPRYVYCPSSSALPPSCTSLSLSFSCPPRHLSLIGRVPPVEGQYGNMRSEPSPFNIADRGTNEYSLNTFFRF